MNTSYYGVSKSVLNCFGKTLVYIKKNSINVYFYLNVVDNESMGFDIVLGRNFMDACNLNMDLNALKMVTVEKVENINADLRIKQKVIHELD